MIRYLVSRFIREPLASPRAPGTAHLEDVREVGIEVNRNRYLDAVEAIVGDLDALDTARVPEHPRAADVDLAAFNGDDAVTKQIRIGQVGLEERIVGAHRRAQEHRMMPKEHQLEAREKTRAVVVEPFLARLAPGNIAAGTEDRERIAMLQHAERCGRAFRIRNDRKALIELIQGGVSRTLRRQCRHRPRWR